MRAWQEFAETSTPTGYRYCRLGARLRLSLSLATSWSEMVREEDVAKQDAEAHGDKWRVNGTSE